MKELFKTKKHLCALLIVSLAMNLMSCSGLPGITQLSIESAMPSYQTRIYNQSDFYKYTERDLLTLYSKYEENLQDFFYKNTEKEETNNILFGRELIIRNHNYITLRDITTNYETLNFDSLHTQYKRLPKLEKPLSLVKEYGCYKNSDMSKVELNIPLDTMKENGLVYSADCDIYETIKIDKSYIDNFSFDIAFKSTPSEENIKNYAKSFKINASKDNYLSKETKDIYLAQISTKSFIAYVENEGVCILYTHTINDDNKTFDLYTVEGNELTKYVKTIPVKILKGAKVAFGLTMPDTAYGIFNNSENTLYTPIENIYKEYKLGTQSTVHEMYKENIYCNRPSFDKKGYLTSLITLTILDPEIQKERENIEVMKRIAEYNNDPLYDNIDEVAKNLAAQQEYSEEDLEKLGKELAESEAALNAKLEGNNIIN